MLNINRSTRPLGKLLLLILLPVFLMACSSSDGDSSVPSTAPTVTTTVGQIQGLVRTYSTPGVDSATPASPGSSYSVYEYRGIPFAEAPVNEKRWALPVPVASLGSEVFKAYEFGPACPQNPRAGSPEKHLNEDCLSLNITTPADIKADEKLPVFFWIHGGAFVGGSSNLYRLDKLANEGRMVVVSTNYRLGALGFMPNAAFGIPSPSGIEYNGNYGLEDQRLAMKWVKDNIAAFGGDNTNVTIAGESAGAGSVCMHVASPEQLVSQSQVKVKDLFHKAIVQSAGCMQKSPTVQEGSEKNNSISASLCSGSADVLACMRGQSIEKILAAQEAYTEANATDVTAIAPVSGSYTVPLSFREAAATDQLVDVPMIIGGTKSELILYSGYFWQDSQKPVNPGPPIEASTIDQWLGVFYPSPGSISAIKGHYPQLSNADSNIVARTFGQVLSDYTPQLGINNCLFLQSSDAILRTRSRTSPIYHFQFADPGAPVLGVSIGEPYPPFEMGPVHSSELNYLFPNISFTSKIDAPDLSPSSQVLANQMVAYWSNFARTGTPNKAGLPEWSPYAGATVAFGGPSVLLLEPNNVKIYDSDKQHSCSSFWVNQYSTLLRLRN
jgi:para-nitrobenzyl esterase